MPGGRMSSIDGALVIADLSADDPDLTGYREHVRNPQHRWVSIAVPLDAGVEISSRSAAPDKESSGWSPLGRGRKEPGR